MNNPKIEIDIAEVLKDMQSKQDKILEEIKDIKIGQTRIEDSIDTLDAKLSGQIKTLEAKVGQLDQRIANQEFTPIRGQANRGVLVGLILALLVGVVKVFGFGGNV